MAALVTGGGKRLRPHTKTHKIPEIARTQVAGGASGVTVAKLGEAEALADHGLDDLFMAHQVVGAPKIERLLSLMRRVNILVGVDSLAVAEPLAEAGRGAGTPVRVRMEVDTGLHRAGVRTPEEAVELGKRLADMPGLTFAGLFTYEGQANLPDPAARAAACHAAAETLRHIAAELRAAGIPVDDLSVGSTPGAPFMAREDGITEQRPGTYIFNDYMQTRYNAAVDDCAATVLATVVSRPDADTAILDAGTKTLSGDRALEGSKHGLVLDDPAIVFDWANEEHGHLDLRNATLQPKVGDKLRIVPWHICTCVNMHDSLYVMRGEQVEAEWRVAGRGKVR
jgi:D-serine deaminase-like pyridoxal phosphate-dependent protein